MLTSTSFATLVVWTRPIKTAQASSSCRSTSTHGVQSHGCYKFDNGDLGFAPLRDQTAHFPVFLHLRVTDLQGPDCITRSSQAQQLRLERPVGKNERKHLRKQLARQDASYPLAMQPKSSPQQGLTMGTLNTSASRQRAIGSAPQPQV